jgi:branched-chain amino acid transport system permease protein
MTLSLVLEVLIQGMLTGLVYGLMALGLSVIFGVVRVVNFAHGEFAVVGMYAAFLLFAALKIDPFVAMGLVAAAFFVVGYFLQRVVVTHFIRRPDHEQFILLVGLAIVMVNGMLMIFGPDARHVELSYSYDSWMLGPVLIDKVRVLAALAAIGVAGALFAFFRYTQTGLAIRACADNLTGAGVVGLVVDRLYALTFGVGLACVGAAGALLIAVSDVTPMLAPSFTHSAIDHQISARLL